MCVIQPPDGPGPGKGGQSFHFSNGPGGGRTFMFRGSNADDIFKSSSYSVFLN